MLGKERGVQVLCEAPAQPVWADLDPSKFVWAVSNLLSNALRVSPSGSRILVRLENSANQIILDFTDQGPGVPESIRHRIFDPYFQGSTPGTSGLLGIGLSIAKEVAEAHGGAISLNPGTPTGSIFRVTLPSPLFGGNA